MATNLGFLRRDVEAQLDAAKQLLELVREVQQSAANASDQRDKELLEQIAKRLAETTERLIKNAGDTGKTVGDLVRGAA